MMLSTPPTMVIAGASGVVGLHLRKAACAAGWNLRVLTTSQVMDAPQRQVQRISWRPARAAAGDEAALGTISHVLEGASVVVNLAGASIADGRLDRKHRQRVLSSRVEATTALAKAWRRTADPPKTWIQASAVGFYGDTGSQSILESSLGGSLFLSRVCEAWEAALDVIGNHRPRIAITRLGLVLAEDAPAWEKMVEPIRYGVGGRLGSGKQWWPWIDADDVARAMLFIVEHDELNGIFNLTAPQPTQQYTLAKAVARRLRRPAMVPVPAVVLRMVLGPVADELLLPSCRAIPERLLEAGYGFLTPTLDTMLDKLLLVA